jgi:hypothetical protein
MKMRLRSCDEADADAEAELLGLLVQRDVLGDWGAETVIAGAVAAPMLVDLGEDDSPAVAGPGGLADRDVGDRFGHLAGREVADPQVEPLRAAVVDERGGEPPVGAHLEGAEADISLPSASAGSSKITCSPPPAEGPRRAQDGALRYQVRYWAPGLYAHQ